MSMIVDDSLQAFKARSLSFDEEDGIDSRAVSLRNSPHRPSLLKERGLPGIGDWTVSIGQIRCRSKSLLFHIEKITDTL